MAKKQNYKSGEIRESVNSAIQVELNNLSSTLSEIQDPAKRLELLLKFMPFVCAPIKQVGHLTARRETGEDDLFNM